MQGVLAPIQFLVFLVSVFLVVRYLSTGEGQTAATLAVLDAHLAVSCGEGTLRPLELQRAGKSPLTAEAFLRGFALAPGTRLV